MKTRVSPVAAAIVVVVALVVVLWAGWRFYIAPSEPPTELPPNFSPFGPAGGAQRSAPSPSSR